MKKKYIWTKENSDDTYAQFLDKFFYETGKVVLRITADYQFAAYINGSFAANGQCADLPEHKVVAQYDVTHLCKAGENVLTVKAYHPGAEWSQSRKMTAAVGYSVVADGEILAVSDENTLCRADPEYSAGDVITPQLGLGYCVDLTAGETLWENATVVEAGFIEESKSIQNTQLYDCPAKPLLWGKYCADGGETAGQIMQNAWQVPLNSLVTEFPVTMHSSSGDGVYLLCDVGHESTGYPYFCVECKEDAVAYFGWGEHLVDGRIRTHIGGRNFAVKITLKAGKNNFADYLRRIGGRYLCLYIQSKKPAIIHHAGILEERYPLRKPTKEFGSQILNSLYETGRRTLELCMHQHYEDCPWREQALYGMDSRNQMLFGYGAFEEYEFPRANLRLMAQCIEEDGLLPLCPPSRNTITIPSFSAYWVLAVYENAIADFQASFVAEMLPAVERVMSVFMGNTQNGAVQTFGDIRYWNFHEWSDGLDGGEIFRTVPVQPVPDAALTAICCRAAQAAAELEHMAKNQKKALEFEEYARVLARGIEQFYVSPKGCFASYIRNGKPEGFHELTQALLLSTGYLKGPFKRNVIRALQGKKGLVPITLSGLALKYEGLLKYSDEDAYVLKDMSATFVPMLKNGSGTYWETVLGQRDFDNAGSLCHGWSAVPCYVLDYIYR